jgi:hypothetical protein
MLVATLVFLAALAAAIFGGRRALRALVVISIVLIPLRGGLLELVEDISLSDSNIAVNALVPALVAALAIGVAYRYRPRLDDFPRPLVVAWVVIAVAVALSFLTKTVGIKLFGIGLAQYLVYPTLALAIWPILEPGDTRRLIRLLILMGCVVTATVLLQAVGVEGFIQAASAQVDGFAANRYAGITGSYLHTSAFLGTTAVLAMGEFATQPSWRGRLAGTVVLAAILSGEVLTFSRSGVVIAMIGVISLFAFAVRGRRVAFAVMVVPAICLAVASGMIGGVAPDAAGDRVTSGFNPKDDPGNKLRRESFEKGLEVYGDSTVPQQTIGRGVGSTGNGNQLIEDDESPQITVESYYLKLLVETGVVGLLLIGVFLVWAALQFAWGVFRSPSPWVAGIAAAALGLSLYNAIYPALETQILALTWWLLLAIFLRARDEAEPSAPPQQGDTASDPELSTAGT